MTRTSAGCRGALLALALPLVFAALGTARAAPLEQEEVTVDGPYTIRQGVPTRPLATREGLPETTVTASTQVGYGDLDLSKCDDVKKLRERVQTAARDTCAQLDRHFPPDLYITGQTHYDCIKSAASDALARVDAIAGKSVARADTAPFMTR